MSSFQVKIVGDFCNIRCTYCRNRDFDQDTNVLMSVANLEKLFVFLDSLPQARIRVNWHGGEPLLAGKKFFHHILRLENQYKQKIWMNAVQTNAMLIDDDWAKLFHDNHFDIGVSIDGSEQTHNSDRINVAGRGTYKEAMRGVEALRHNSIHPGVICTVTKKTVRYAKEMLLDLVDAGFKSIAFNAFYNTASDCDGDTYGLTDTEWLAFLIEIFETWLVLNDPTIRVRELDSMLAWTKSKSANSCVYKGTCYQWFAIHYTGDIYPCERLGKSTHFGSIDSLRTFQDLVNTPVFLNWKESIGQLPQRCRTCSLQSLCHNGCVSHRKADEEGVPLYRYCESRLGFYDYIKERLK
ncbi:MAG: radical SAM protein [bacterium]|nr:radical SAM protein [bacterium]